MRGDMVFVALMWLLGSDESSVCGLRCSCLPFGLDLNIKMQRASSASRKPTPQRRSLVNCLTIPGMTRMVGQSLTAAPPLGALRAC